MASQPHGQMNERTMPRPKEPSDGLFRQTRFVRHHQQEHIVKALKNMWTVMALANSLLAAMSIVPLTIVPDSFRSTSESPSESTSTTDDHQNAATKTAYGVFWMLTIGCNLLALFMAITLLTYAVTAPNIFDLLGFKHKQNHKHHSNVGCFVVFPYYITALGVIFLSVALAITAHAFYGLGVCILAIVFFAVGFVIYACLVAAHCGYVKQYKTLYRHGEKGKIDYTINKWRQLEEAVPSEGGASTVVKVQVDGESARNDDGSTGTAIDCSKQHLWYKCNDGAAWELARKWAAASQAVFDRAASSLR